ncbi:iron ABC transporter permease (plasmid) [Photobacterium sp. GJ3]|uniref:FecCD family ABC transporter permease n=1 Tax=Photobacterium sp. GJ3 TaxID=2829502 RepID=UPI001B8D623A|nr:iron ABC transporter permease [Photobacterium sp. GJ3]QUJ69489.1 iron ABC transporter permease [Photobacterium sp. GJ3]
MTERSLIASRPANPPEGIYSQLSGRRKRLLWLGLVSLFLTGLIDISTGSSPLSFGELLQTLLAGPEGTALNTTIVWQLRLPVTLTCFVVGASLGLAGGLMQTLLANPLASPYTLGISAAAGFGAGFALLTGFSVAGIHWLGIPVAAFVTAGLASLGIWQIGRLQHMNARSLILAGIVVLFFFQALQSLVQYLAAPEVLQQIVFWLFGSLLKANWTSFWVSGLIFICVFLAVIPRVWKLTALSVGDDKAQALGIKTSRLRLEIFLLCSLLTAGAVSFVGTIGFVGLVAPHLARMLVGEDQRFYLPLSALMGALILTAASLVSKLIVPGTIIPIGIVTSLVGVPFLLYFLIREGGRP